LWPYSFIVFSVSVSMNYLLVLLVILPALVEGGKLREIYNELEADLSCRNEGDDCHSMPRCCGELQCYWEEKWNPLEAGRCVTCVSQGLRCQRDAQCCEGYQCDKDTVIDINGRCQPPRRQGNVCHCDSMCVSDECDKKWYQLYGECT